MSLHDRIKEARKSKGLTQTELGRCIGVAKTTIAGYEKKSEPTAAQLGAIADALDVGVGFLLQDEVKLRKEIFATPAEMEHIRKYRTLDEYGRKVVDVVLDIEVERAEGERQKKLQEAEETEDNVVWLSFRCSTQPASAGIGTYLGPEAFETIMVQENELTRRASFGVPVSGDSMEPRYHNGDILIVEGAEEIEPGEIGVFSVDGNGYVKELGNGELISLNPTYDPIPTTESTWCHGRVIGVLNPEWIAEE